jgi:hypothetical protein
MTKTIRDKLVEGIVSGPPVLADDAYWRRILSRVKARVAERTRPKDDT